MFFTTPPTPRFKPLPPPLPPRKPCTTTCNPQPQSPFLTLLPAEIRNLIYTYTFTSTSAELIFGAHDPLALLLTCHKINHEATTLAFHHHTFSAKPSHKAVTFLGLQTKIQHLSAQQVDAISALSWDLASKYPLAPGAAAVLTNALILFPRLQRFEIRIRRGVKLQNEVHQSAYLTGHVFTNPHDAAVEKFAPWWFSHGTLKPLTDGHCFAWQEGEKWSVEWPQLRSRDFEVLSEFDFQGEERKTPYMSIYALLLERGVHLCVCGCGEVSWLAADLVQQTGRRVVLDTVFYGAEDLPKGHDEERFASLKVRLRPDAEKLVVTQMGGEGAEATSIAYDVDEEYWDTLRRRNWNWSAMWRGLWTKRRRCAGGYW